MGRDRQQLLNVQRDLERCIEELRQCNAPSGIAEHIRSALKRLEDHMAMLDRWEAGESSER